jgi:hypothetical protein
MTLATRGRSPETASPGVALVLGTMNGTADMLTFPRWQPRSQTVVVVLNLFGLDILTVERHIRWSSRLGSAYNASITSWIHEPAGARSRGGAQQLDPPRYELLASSRQQQRVSLEFALDQVH